MQPLDNEININGISKEAIGLEISRANESLILSADAVIADLNLFRGRALMQEPYLKWRLRKVILGYIHNERKFLQRNIDELNKVIFLGGECKDTNNMTVEDL